MSEIVKEITESISSMFTSATYGEGPMMKPKIAETILDCVGGTPIVSALLSAKTD